MNFKKSNRDQKKKQKIKIKEFKKKVSCCPSDQLPQILNEIKTSDLTKEERIMLRRVILIRPAVATNPSVLPNDIINQIKEESLEELGEKRFKKTMQWRIWEAERDNDNLKNGEKTSS